MRRSQRQESTDSARGPIQKPATAHIGEQGDGDLGHTDTGSLTHHAMATTRHHAHATAHHNAVAPADYRLGVREEDVVHLIFAGKEILSVSAGPAGILDRGAAQFVYIATCTKGFFTRTVNIDRRYRVVFSPL